MSHPSTFPVDPVDAASTLLDMTEAEVDALDFGVDETDPQCRVLRDHATESRYQGLPPERDGASPALGA